MFDTIVCIQMLRGKCPTLKFCRLIMDCGKENQIFSNIMPVINRFCLVCILIEQLDANRVVKTFMYVCITGRMNYRYFLAAVFCFLLCFSAQMQSSTDMKVIAKLKIEINK